MRTRSVAFTVLLAACAGAPAASRGPAPAPVAFPFELASVQTEHVNGRFAGTAAIADGRVDVIVRAGNVQVSRRDSVELARLQLRAGVVACGSAGRAGKTSESEPVRLAPLLRSDNGTSASLSDSIHFAIAIPRGIAPEKTHVALFFEWADAGEARGEATLSSIAQRCP